MKIIKYTIVGILLIGIVISIGLFVYYRSLFEQVKSPVYRSEEVYFPQRNQKVYFKEIRRGLNYSVKYVTTSPKGDSPDINTDYVFETDLDIFYKTNQDTLVIYVRDLSETPINFGGEIQVQQMELSNPDYMNLYDKRDVLGLKIF